jgi:hypothetical protein
MYVRIIHDLNDIGDVKGSLLASSVIDRGFEG